MLEKNKPIFEFIFIIIVWISSIILIAKIVGWFIFLVSPRALDIECGGILLLVVWLHVLQKTWVETNTTGCINAFRWLGLLIATLLFIGFYQLINTLDTMGQIGCRFVIFVLVLGILSPLIPTPSIAGDDEDDYHASR
jgi:hypothetical protein